MLSHYRRMVNLNLLTCATDYWEYLHCHMNWFRRLLSFNREGLTSGVSFDVPPPIDFALNRCSEINAGRSNSCLYVKSTKQMFHMFFDSSLPNPEFGRNSIVCISLCN